MRMQEKNGKVEEKPMQNRRKSRNKNRSFSWSRTGCWYTDFVHIPGLLQEVLMDETFNLDELFCLSIVSDILKVGPYVFVVTRASMKWSMNALLINSIPTVPTKFFN